MKYPFRVGEQYFTPAQDKHIKEFLAKEPIPKDTWIKPSGEERLVIRVDFPEGTVIPGRTVYATDKAGVKWYHTPCAKVPGREAKIIYQAGGKWHTCTSSEWLEWAGDDYQLNEYKPPELSEADEKKQEAMIGMLRRNTPTQADLNEGAAKWQPAKSKKSTK